MSDQAPQLPPQPVRHIKAPQLITKAEYDKLHTKDVCLAQEFSYFLQRIYPGSGAMPEEQHRQIYRAWFMGAHIMHKKYMAAATLPPAEAQNLLSAIDAEITDTMVQLLLSNKARN